MKKIVTEITLGGYVNPTRQRSRNIFPASTCKNAPGPFVECVQPGAFHRALFWRPNVRLTVDHDRVIGSTRSGELQLVEDTIGLKAVALIRDDEVVYAAKWGRIRGWSFSFASLQDSWDQIGDHLYRRMIKRMSLHEVSLILNGCPAYPGTTVNLVEGDYYDSF